MRGMKLTHSSQNPRHNHLCPLDAGTHQNRAHEQNGRANDQCPLAPQRFCRERGGNGPSDGADVVDGGDRADHDRTGVAHLVEPVLGDDDAGHDALVVAKQAEASRADRREHSDECGPAQAVHSQLRRQYCHSATRCSMCASNGEDASVVELSRNWGSRSVSLADVLRVFCSFIYRRDMRRLWSGPVPSHRRVGKVMW